MNDPTLASIRERLERLERHNRYLKLAGALLLTGMLVSGAIAQGFSPTVEAERFILKDRRGRVRAAFGLAGDGAPVLSFNDEDGMTRLLLGVVNGEARLQAAGRDGKIVWKAPSY